MSESEKKIALSLIEKVKAIISDMPDPKIENLDVSHYDGLKCDTYRLKIRLNDGSELHLYLDEKRPA